LPYPERQGVAQGSQEVAKSLPPVAQGSQEVAKSLPPVAQGSQEVAKSLPPVAQGFLYARQDSSGIRSSHRANHLLGDHR
jgi:hypothetical protein